MRRAGHILFGLVLALAPFAQVPFAPAQAQTSLEYAVKAAYITKFLPFISWPDSVFSGADAPLAICILGGDPFGPIIDKAAAAGGIGRPIIVRRLGLTDVVDGCQVVFTADPTVEIGYLRDKPLITVTDSTIQSRGTFNFVIEDNHVRFDIDDSDAQASGIRISSKLLGLARKVTRRSAP